MWKAQLCVGKVWPGRQGPKGRLLGKVDDT